ncbi:MAG: helix-turn-helix domain-containing protein [Gammaproteobacteria bacterium]
MNKLALLLDKLMEKREITESELARRTGISQPVINRLLCGRNDNPKLTTLLPIANYFSLSLSELIGEAPLPEGFLSTTSSNLEKPIVRVPVLNWEDVIEWPKNKDNIKPIDTHVVNVSISVDGYALKLLDITMGLIFPEGTLIIVDPSLQPIDRNLVIIHILGKKLPIFRQILFDMDKVYLKPFNSDLNITLLEKKYVILGVAVESINNLLQKKLI